MMLLIYDKSNNRFKEVHTNENMTIETVNEIMKKDGAPKYRRVFAGEIFQEATINGDDDGHDDIDHHDDGVTIAQEQFDG